MVLIDCFQILHLIRLVAIRLCIAFRYSLFAALRASDILSRLPTRLALCWVVVIGFNWCIAKLYLYHGPATGERSELGPVRFFCQVAARQTFYHLVWLRRGMIIRSIRQRLKHCRFDCKIVAPAGRTHRMLCRMLSVAVVRFGIAIHAISVGDRPFAVGHKAANGKLSNSRQSKYACW